MAKYNYKLYAPSFTSFHVDKSVAIGLAPPDLGRWENNKGRWEFLVMSSDSSAVAALQAFIDNPPADTSYDANIAALTDKWLSVQSCFLAIPVAPSEGDDPYASLRTRLKADLDVAKVSMEAAGGPK